MYYKIENTESEVYKKLLELRTNEKAMEAANEKAIEEKTGHKWKNYLGRKGQQNIRRVTEYNGFEFLNPENVCLKTWKPDSQHKQVFVPNSRTNLGREMRYFLSNGLQSSWFEAPLKILGINSGSKFQFPYVENVNGVIILFLDENHQPKDENVIEITSKEFNEIHNRQTSAV